MKNILSITLLGFVFGIVGTGLGGVIAFFINTHTTKLISVLLEFAAGLMMSVVCFDLLPHGFELGGMEFTCASLIVGALVMIILDDWVKKSNIIKKTPGDKSLLKAGILVAIGIALHNLPEGLAIGSGFEASRKLGLSLAFVIALHDIPEGLAMAVPMRVGGMTKTKALVLTLLSGVPTGIGAFIGVALGSIADWMIAACLGFAGGAMLYIICGELIPESKKMYKGRLSSVANIIGMIAGIFIVFGGH